jgi:hypothetical protein
MGFVFLLAGKNAEEQLMTIDYRLFLSVENVTIWAVIGIGSATRLNKVHDAALKAISESRFHQGRNGSRASRRNDWARRKGSCD